MEMPAPRTFLLQCLTDHRAQVRLRLEEMHLALWSDSLQHRQADGPVVRPDIEEHVTGLGELTANALDLEVIAAEQPQDAAMVIVHRDRDAQAALNQRHLLFGDKTKERVGH